VDSHVLHKIINTAQVCQQDCVLEIGPGIGAVTQELAERAGRVCAVELDTRTVEVLKDMYRSFNHVGIVNADILKLDLYELLSPYAGMPLKVVANLPYYITTPVIMRLLENGPRFDSVTVMIQREVAQRLCAKPCDKTKNYGALSLAAQYYANIHIAAYVPPNCFMPRPKVDSAVVHLTPWDTPPVDTDRDWLFYIIHASFNQRRKTLVNALLTYPNPYGGITGKSPVMTRDSITDALTHMGLPADVRGETLSLTEFAQLANMLQHN
jgi:16S rRNA (adenine1518-N6/adenine1519-N6)-dimethyltransferase